MKIIEIFTIGIVALAFMLITGVAKANPVTDWLTNEYNKTVEYQTQSWANAKKQTEQTKLNLQNLWSKVKENVTQN
tara:strand:- start:305 stop:532 length:228 start_codon:yes stop_codon:yes gene_type:complete